jgi:endonuclease/exonuclease/phosphatase family protein
MANALEAKFKVSSIRIATYNIHKCLGLDRRVRPKCIAEVLRQTNADIIALQEVVGMDEGAREHNQVRAIADDPDSESARIVGFGAELTAMRCLVGYQLSLIAITTSLGARTSRALGAVVSDKNLHFHFPS